MASEIKYLFVNMLKVLLTTESQRIRKSKKKKKIKFTPDELHSRLVEKSMNQGYTWVSRVGFSVANICSDHNCYQQILQASEKQTKPNKPKRKKQQHFKKSGL